MSLAGMSPTKLSLRGIIKLFPARESLVGDIPAEDGKSLTFSYSVQEFQLTAMILFKKQIESYSRENEWKCRCDFPG